MQVVVRIVVALLVCEAMVRGLMLRDRLEVTAVQPTPWDRAARMLWTDRRLKSLVTGGPSWDAVGPEGWWDAELGWDRRAGDAETDAHGCRDGGLPRAPGAVPVVLVGDSYTYGTEVPVEASYGHLLELRRPDVDVHDLALPAYDHLQATLRWERLGPGLHPAAVVLLGIGVDAPRSRFWFYGYGKPWPELDAGGALRVAGQPVDTPLATFAKGLASPRVLDLAWIVRERWAATVEQQARVDDAERRVRAVLDRWAASVIASGALPVLLAVPTPQELVDLHRGDRTWVDRSRGLYARWCEGRPFPCDDLWDELDTPDVEAYRAGVHFSAATNGRIAGLVEARLVDAGVLPASADVDGGVDDHGAERRPDQRADGAVEP